MDTAVLEVVLGLVLIYLVLALLVSKVQEALVGQMRSGRAKNLHDMVLEAVGRDPGLHSRIFANPLVFALSEGGEVANRSGNWRNLWTAVGPSALPPTLFARALLVELYNDGKHSAPRDRYTTPRAFLADKAPQQAAAAASDRIWGSMRSLAAGRDNDWDAFEAAIATWFVHIGDRADGWYQRTAQNWALIFSFIAAVALNVDTFALSERLTNEPIARRTLAALAQQVNALFPGGRDVTATNPQPAAPVVAKAPALRADEALQKASVLLTDAYFRSEDVARFDPNRQKVLRGTNIEDQVKNCANVGGGIETTVGRSSARSTDKSSTTDHLSNPSTWVGLLPPLRAFVRQQRLPMPVSSAPTLPLGEAASAAVCAAKDANVCQPRGDKNLTIVFGDIRPNGNVADAAVAAGAFGTDDNLRTAYRCITNLVGWVNIAEGASTVGAVQSNLRGAANSLDEAADALLELIQDQGGTFLLTRLFQADPEVFDACARQPGMTRNGLRRCVNAHLAETLSLPIGHTGRNWRMAFCEPSSFRQGDALPLPGGLCGGMSTFRGRPDLQIEPMVLVGKPPIQTGLLFLLGCLVTALFVALGAPFWFDVLGRVTKLRAAGGRRDPDLGKGGGGGTGAGGDTGPQPKGPDSPAPFSLARNIVEQQMLSSDIADLQTGLGITPTGVLDGPTRIALAARAAKEGLSSGDEVSLVLFDRVVGAHPAYLIGKLPTEGDKQALAGTPHPQAQLLADKLGTALAFTGRITPPISQITADLRALIVLYRYKKERQGGKVPHDCPVVADARIKGKLDEVPEALLTEIQTLPASTALARETAPWMDWALGELGQFEADAANVSVPNPRVVEYLHSVEPSQHNPIQTSWCAAFVSWVLASHQALPPLGRQGFTVVLKSLRALDFGGTAAKTWGTTVWPVANGRADTPWDQRGIEPGDIVTTRPVAPEKRNVTADNPDGVSHVAFVLEVDATTIWALGGNQNAGQEVCVSRFPNPDDEVVEVRRPPVAPGA